MGVDAEADRRLRRVMGVSGRRVLHHAGGEDPVLGAARADQRRCRGGRRHAPPAPPPAAVDAGGRGDLWPSRAGTSSTPYVTDVQHGPDPFPFFGDAVLPGRVPACWSPGCTCCPRRPAGGTGPGSSTPLVADGRAGPAVLDLPDPRRTVYNAQLGGLEPGRVHRLSTVRHPRSSRPRMRLVTAARRTPALLALPVGSLGLLVSDVIYGVVQLPAAAGRTGGPGRRSAGSSSTGPGARPRCTRRWSGSPSRGSSGSAEPTRPRLVMLAVSALIGAGCPARSSAARRCHDGLVIAGLSAIMFLLVLVPARRGGGRSTGRRWPRTRPARGGRRAGLGHRRRRGAARRARRGRESAAAAPARCPDHPGRRRAASVDPPVDAADACAITELRARDGRARWPASISRWSTRWSWRTARPGDPLLGVLLVAADEASLVALQASLEVLASQAALAIERITLSNEIARRNSEEYFRTLVHNTSDVILILADDNRIRYASPSAETVFGRPAVLHRTGPRPGPPARPGPGLAGAAARPGGARRLRHRRLAGAARRRTASSRWRSPAATCVTIPPSRVSCSRCGT